MLKEIVNKTFPHYSEERKSEVCEFLKEQEIKEKYDNEIDTFISSLLVISKLYDEIPNLKLMYDKNIKTTQRKIQIAFTRDQIDDLKHIGVDHIEQLLYTMYNELLNEMKKETTTYIDNFISVDRDFLLIKLIDTDSYNPKLLMVVNCKVLSLKDLRKLKLNKINSV